MGPHPMIEWDTFSLFIINAVRPLVDSFGSLSRLGDYTYFSFLGGLVSASDRSLLSCFDLCSVSCLLGSFS
jgi:hypothetical protein